MKVLITGATGFVGRNLVPVLIGDGNELLELTRDIGKSEALFGKTTRKYLITEDQEALVQSITKFKPDIVIHLASYLTSGDSYSDMEKLIHSNLFFLSRILDALKQSPPKLFINTGTFAEYFEGDGKLNPAYLYAATKSASRSFLEYYAKAYQFVYTTVVPYTIYGGKDTQKKIIDIIYDSINNTTCLDLSPGEQILDFIHISDVVGFYQTLLLNYDKIPIKSVFHLGSGKGHNLKEVAAFVETLVGGRCNIKWGGKPYRPADVMYAVANTAAQFRQFKWRPQVSLQQGLQLYLETKKLTE